MEYTTVWLCVTFLHHNIGLHTFGRNLHVIMLNSSHHIKSYMLHHSVSASVHYEHLVKVVAARFLPYEVTVFSPLMEKCLVGDTLRLCEYHITFQNFYPLFL